MEVIDLIKKLEEVKHYKKYPKMIPFVGNDYISDNHKKLLIIAESHYLPNESTLHLNAEKWYSGDENLLNDEEKEWIWTSNIARYLKKSIFVNIFNALIKAGVNRSNEREQVAFMNYFQRPAIERQSFKKVCTQLDKDEAAENIRSVVSILKPDLIIFVSKYSIAVAEETNLWEFTSKYDCTYTYTNHPACSWWNRATRFDFFKGRTSREHFKFFLDKNNFIKSDKEI